MWFQWGPRWNLRRWYMLVGGIIPLEASSRSSLHGTTWIRENLNVLESKQPSYLIELNLSLTLETHAFSKFESTPDRVPNIQPLIRFWNELYFLERDQRFGHKLFTIVIQVSVRLGSEGAALTWMLSCSKHSCWSSHLGDPTSSSLNFLRFSMRRSASNADIPSAVVAMVISWQVRACFVPSKFNSSVNTNRVIAVGASVTQVIIPQQEDCLLLFEDAVFWLWFHQQSIQSLTKAKKNWKWGHWFLKY